MINIELSEHCTFTFNPNDLSICIWDHAEGQFKGKVMGQVGKIKFYNFTQVCHFLEMLEFLREGTDKEKDMGEIAEAILDGTLCQVCGGLVIDVAESPPGYPQNCEYCDGKESRGKKKGKKIKLRRKVYMRTEDD